MSEVRRGGARPGSGRKPTGAKTKHYTVNLPIEEAELLEKHAAERGMSVNKYLRELIRQVGQYGNVHIVGGFVDDQYTD